MIRLDVILPSLFAPPAVQNYTQSKPIRLLISLSGIKVCDDTSEVSVPLPMPPTVSLERVVVLVVAACVLPTVYGTPPHIHIRLAMDDVG